MTRTIKQLISISLVLLMVFSVIPVMTGASYAADDQPISYTYGGKYRFDKISNPTAGSKEADGINTKDETGYPANRLNSYAWAVASRGDYIYIGTNRTLFGSAINSLQKMLAEADPDTPMTRERLNAAVALISMGDVPVNLEDEEYIPQIIRFDVKNGTTKVIYQPSTKIGEDSILYYTDKSGNIIQTADVASETASFRSVVEYKGNLYFGSLGLHMLQVVRIDENDNADVVYEPMGQYSSLRAGCVYNDGDEDILCFGGQDTSYGKWRREYGTATDRPLPIVIRYPDPATVGTDQEDWSNLIADYEDFGKYAKATVYSSGGGNVWDLCSYNGKLYLILAYDSGWVMFRGEKGGSHPNSFGWTWTEIVGDNGSYPAAMDASIGEMNAFIDKEYGCREYGNRLNNAGLLESTATPFVYQGKMYIGTFDNATNLQSQTMTKLLTKLRNALNPDAEMKGPTLKQIYAPIYEVLSHPQHVWVMDENEKITPVDEANDLLNGTTNDYVWRFIEHKGRLYAGTFDSSTAYNYYLGTHLSDLLEQMCAADPSIPKSSRELLNGKIVDKIRSLADRYRSQEVHAGNISLQKEADDLLTASEETCRLLEKFYSGDCTVDEIIPAIKNLKSIRETISDKQESLINSKAFSALIDKADSILDFFDIEGLIYWSKARALVRKENKGFDLLTTTDGEHWNRILDDGINDRYNYGGRTFTVCNGELYVGTANPYYGAQLWKITELPAPAVDLKMKAGSTVDVSKEAGVSASWTSTNTKVATVKNGNITALKKGSSTITATLEDGTEQIFNVNVTTSPKLARKTLKVKKGKTAKVRIIGKAPGVKNKYKNTKYAKVISGSNATVLKVKGLKKGKTTLKIKVNGVNLKLKVTVK